MTPIIAGLAVGFGSAAVLIGIAELTSQRQSNHPSWVNTSAMPWPWLKWHRSGQLSIQLPFVHLAIGRAYDNKAWGASINSRLGIHRQFGGWKR